MNLETNYQENVKNKFEKFSIKLIDSINKLKEIVRKFYSSEDQDPKNISKFLTSLDDFEDGFISYCESATSDYKLVYDLFDDISHYNDMDMLRDIINYILLKYGITESFIEEFKKRDVHLTEEGKKEININLTANWLHFSNICNLISTVAEKNNNA